jgi:hypothetical protein
VILGEIEKKSLDVKIIYANTAACDFTGYHPGEMTFDNPKGLLGRSVTELMEQELSDAHPSYIENWLNRRGIVSSSRNTSIRSVGSTDSAFSEGGQMKEVEGISRRVTIVNIDGRVLPAEAALSFFTARGIKKVVGIFSFKAAETLDTVSFEGLAFNLQFKPVNSDNSFYVVVDTPSRLSDFVSDEKWRITVVSEGLTLEEKDKVVIRNLIRKQVFHHIGKISCGSGLDLTFVDEDKHCLSEVPMKQLSTNLKASINDSRGEKNMHLTCSDRVDDRNDVELFADNFDADFLAKDEI